MNQAQEIFKNLGLIKGDKTQINLQCFLPTHNEVHGKSLFINFDTNRFECYGKCKKKGNLQELLSVLGHSIVLDNSYIIETMFNKARYVEKKLEPIGIDKLIKDYDKGIKDIEYLDNRGINKEVYKANKVFLNHEDQRIYLPCWFNQEFYGYVSRTIFDVDNIWKKIAYETNTEINSLNKKDIEFEILYEKDSIYRKYNKLAWKYKFFDRYLNDYSLPKQEIVYEPLTNSPDINLHIVGEGIFDSLYHNGYGYNSFAIIGQGINAKQVDYILNKCAGKRLILGFDNDVAGEKYYFKFLELAKMIIPRLNWNLLNRKVKDSGDVTKEELDFLYNNAYYV